MKKILLTLICTATCTSFSLATPRSAREAQEIASQFFARHTLNTRGSMASANVTLAATSTQLQTVRPQTRQTADQPAYYIYNQGDRGFVIVSGDDRMASILGYSFENPFSEANLPDNMRFWLNQYVLQQQQLESTADTPSETTATSAAANNFAPSVAPLLGDIRYDQGDPYNRLCPTVNGRRCVTGCVATAMANILSYYQYPTKGTGSHSYVSQTNQLSVSFDYANTTFDWNNILKQYVSGQYNDTQANAIAQLMLACGVACDMNYDPSASGSSVYTAVSGMKNYLGYNPYAYCARGDHYSPTEWVNMIKTELNAQRPVYFTASDNSYTGHAFILDGYDEEGLMHVDWGWSGMSNGYYLVAELQPGASGTGGGDGSGYQFEQIMVVGLAPSTMLSDKVSHFEAYDLSYNAANKTFTVNNIFNYSETFNGSMAIVAGNDERQFAISQVQDLQGLNNLYGYKNIQFGMQVLPVLVDGVYDIFIGTKLAGNSKWDKVPCEYASSPKYSLVVENGTATVVTENSDLTNPNVTVKSDGTLHSNRLATFTITISNPRANNDFLGHMELDIVDNSGTTIESIRLQQLYLKPGESKVLTRTITMPDVIGNVTVKPIWVHNNYQRYVVGTPASFYVFSQGTPATGFTTSDVKLANTSVEQGSAFTCTGTLTLNNDGDYYETQLVAYLYSPNTGTYETSSPMTPVSVEKSGPKTFSIDLNIPADTKTGRYQFQLFSYESGQFHQLFNENVRITAYTGIESVSTADALRLVSADASGISLSSSQAVRSLSLYDLQGRLLRTSFSSEGSGRYRMATDGLPAGTYIIQATLANGSKQTIKCFLR